MHGDVFWFKDTACRSLEFECRHQMNESTIIPQHCFIRDSDVKYRLI